MSITTKQLSALLLSSLLLSGCDAISGIPPEQAAAMLQNQQAIIVDVREANEWQQKHIPGARHIPLQQLSTRLNELEPYKNSPIIMQCQSGKRSAKAVELLKKAGFTQVSNLEGGLLAWSKVGLQTE